MTRKALKQHLDKRLRLTARLERYGTKPGWFRDRPKQTVLLLDVCLDGKQITDHLWLNRTKTFDRAMARPGQIITFEARVVEYVKGYQGRRAESEGIDWCEIDYKVSHPTRFAVVEQEKAA